MSDLHIWKNPLIPIEQRLELAVIEINKLRSLLYRYRNEVPIGHQPHMIAHEVDVALLSYNALLSGWRSQSD